MTGLYWLYRPSLHFLLSEVSIAELSDSIYPHIVDTIHYTCIVGTVTTRILEGGTSVSIK
jgi:hypothetical protein